jgi:hypothetical protein
MAQQINSTNWNYAFYESGAFRASITFGADESSLAKNEYLYFVTVLEGEYKEIHQELQPNLTQACTVINKRYKNWIFKDPSAPASGCGSCSAH